MYLSELQQGERKDAFTLIELLTVIAVIAVLAGLMLPALSTSKARALQIKCASHLRQIGIAWSLYFTEHNGHLVPNVDGLDASPVAFSWVSGNTAVAGQGTNISLLIDPKISLLGPYIRAAALFKCPSDRSSFVRSVSMNNRMNPVRFSGSPGWVGGKGTNYVTFRSFEQIYTPSRTFTILEERFDSINDAYFAIDLSNTGSPDGTGRSNPYYIIDYPASYHNKRGNLAFADGHIESKQWVESSTVPALGAVKPRSYTSANDRDMAWLQEHASSAR